MKLGVFYFVKERTLPSESFPNFEPGIGSRGLKRNCSASAFCADDLKLLSVAIPSPDAIRAGDDAEHTVKGKKIRLLIVAACRNFAGTNSHHREA
jgi:hypothetical protein